MFAIKVTASMVVTVNQSKRCLFVTLPPLGWNALSRLHNQTFNGNGMLFESFHLLTNTIIVSVACLLPEATKSRVRNSMTPLFSGSSVLSAFLWVCWIVERTAMHCSCAVDAFMMSHCQLTAQRDMWLPACLMHWWSNLGSLIHSNKHNIQGIFFYNYIVVSAVWSNPLGSFKKIQFYVSAQKIKGFTLHKRSTKGGLLTDHII